MKESTVKQEVINQTVLESKQEEAIKEAVIQKAPKKTDVTWGVRVPEKLKNELNTMMHEVDVSGKEFIEMLISSYRLEEAKRKGNLYESDVRELQILLKRVQALFSNSIERTLSINIEEQNKIERLQEQHKIEIEKMTSQRAELSKALGTAKANYNESMRSEKAAQKALEEAKKQLSQQKVQLENNALLYKKFEDEVTKLKQELKSLQPFQEKFIKVQKDYENLKDAYTKQEERLQTQAQELKRYTQEKEALKKRYEQEIQNNQIQFELQLKNGILETQLDAEKKMSLLKDKITRLEKENPKTKSSEISS